MDLDVREPRASEFEVPGRSGVRVDLADEYAPARAEARERADGVDVHATGDEHVRARARKWAEERTHAPRA
jgi:hypothetical protein